MPDCAMMGASSSRRQSRPIVCDPARTLTEVRSEPGISEPPQLSALSRSRRRRRSRSLGAVGRWNPEIPCRPIQSRSISSATRRPLPGSDLVVLGHAPHATNIDSITPSLSSPVPVVDDAVEAIPLDDLVAEEDELHPSSIDEAIELIKAFYESGISEPISMKLTGDIYVDFLDACEQACHSYPFHKMRYTYDSRTSNLIIKCTTTPAHDAVERFFLTSYQDIIEDYAITRSERSFAFVSTGDTGGFSGSHKGSRKTADGMIVPVIARGRAEDDALNDGFPLVAIEVGFSQKYESLLLYMTKWLEGSNGKTRAVLIFSFAEDPVYSSKPFTEPPVAKLEPSTVPEELVIATTASDEPAYGPILRDGNVQVGAITVFLEIWRYNAIEQAPYLESKISIIPADDEHQHFNLTMLDLYGEEERIPGRFKPTDPVKFSLEEYRREIRLALPRLALQRQQKIDLKMKPKRGQEDKMYRPETEAKRVKRE